MALVCSLLLLFCCVEGRPPNILFLLVDDQDVDSRAMSMALPYTSRFFMQHGVEFTNAFASVPVCCPSRASILTGLYAHNHHCTNLTVEGNCSSPFWQAHGEQDTYATRLQQHGYYTAHIGKYLNAYGSPAAGGLQHVPPGWTHWVSLVGNSVYYNYTLSRNGKAEAHNDSYPKDYLTALVRREAVQVLSNWASNASRPPLLLTLSFPAPHDPVTSAPEYARLFLDRQAPRGPDFNWPARDHAPFVADFPLLNDSQVEFLDLHYTKRLQTLRSVDDAVHVSNLQLALSSLLLTSFYYIKRLQTLRCTRITK
eukprot:g24314.t1